MMHIAMGSNWLGCSKMSSMMHGSVMPMMMRMIFLFQDAKEDKTTLILSSDGALLLAYFQTRKVPLS